jgi:hypothetical protein
VHRGVAAGLHHHERHAETFADTDGLSLKLITLSKRYLLAQNSASGI